MENCLPEDIIKCNFFRLSLPSQIKIYEMYLNDLRDTRYCEYFRKLFKKYIGIVIRFNAFKSEYSDYTNNDKNDLRYVIDKCRNKINPNNNVVSDPYSNMYQNMIDAIPDSFVEKYIYDSFSYSKFKRRRIVLEFIACYSEINSYNFEETLCLFNGNKDFFNQEIKNLDSNFYSLYLSMDTVDRMKYIWYLSNLDVMKSSQYKANDLVDVFKDDNKLIKPIQKVKVDVNKFSKYFNMNC